MPRDLSAIESCRRLGITLDALYRLIYAGRLPIVHNEENKAYAGGVVQDKGLNNSVGELATVSAHLALLVSKYAKMDDMFSMLSESFER
jgi:hypothetical protein